jgi:hypothetical protein
MGILDELLAGGKRQNEYKDFVNRYEQGAPSEGYSDQEVLKRYSEVAHAVAPDHYAQAAEEAPSKLSPAERAALVKMLQEQASGPNPIIEILKSPMAKAVLAGIAAMVVKRVMNPSQRA